VACFNKAAPKIKVSFGDQECEFVKDISVVGVPFNTDAMSNGSQTLGPPFKARATVARCKDLARNGFDIEMALQVLTMSVSSTVLYGSPTHAVHPKAQILQNDLMQAILGTYRNSRLSRSHLCLSLLRVASAATIRRVTSAMSFRLSPLKKMRTWIDEALRDKWAWGKLLSADLDRIPGLRGLWDQFLPRVTAALPHTRDAVLREFKRKVKHAVTEDDEAANKANLVYAATARQILPWRGVHPRPPAL